MKELIIFVHGAFSSTSSWAYHRRVLRPTLKTREVKLYSYDVESDPSIHIVDGLIDLVLESAEGVDQVTFIGHSFGGVISIDAVRRMVNQNLLDGVKFKVLTVASPLGGSGAASFLRFLKPFSQFLKNVGSFDTYMSEFKGSELPCKVHCVVANANFSDDSLIKDSDGVVTIASQEHFKGDPNCTISYILKNHFEVLLDPSVTKVIKQFVENVDTELEAVL